MRNKKCFLLLLKGLLILLPVSVYAASHEFCDEYANSAVTQLQQAQSKGILNLNPPMWQSDYGPHYLWCRIVSEADANAETAKRQTVIDTGSPIGGPLKFEAVIIPPPEFPFGFKELPIEEQCEEYANKSVQQSNKNISMNCGYGGDNNANWLVDYNLHYDWCLRGDNRKKIWEELRIRDADLKNCQDAKAQAATAIRPPDDDRNRKIFIIPGMVLNLRHARCLLGPPAPIIGCTGGCDTNVYGLSDPSLGRPAVVNHHVLDYFCGGDAGADKHVGLTWNMVEDYTAHSLDQWTMPPGLALGLKHRKNQMNIPITAFGFDASNDNVVNNKIGWRDGGDRKATAGFGYVWYETTGSDFKRWDLVDLLPKYTVIGLKHTQNQKGHKFFWKDREYDCACATCQSPPGFRRFMGGDYGAGKNQGFCWFEKMTGPVP